VNEGTGTGEVEGADDGEVEGEGERDVEGEGERAQPTIRVSAVLAVDDTGRLLVVRKRGTTVWMQPGGKPEPGETAAETLMRELHEELGVHLDPTALEPLGTFTTAAANEVGTTLIADVFRASIREPLIAAAEIDAVRWMHPDEFGHHPVAPLITQHMLALMPLMPLMPLLPLLPPARVLP